MQFFFDVPEASIAADDGQTSAATAILVSTQSQVRSPRAVHEPFRRGQCHECHDASDRQHVREDYLNACASCHATYFGAQVGHPPVQKRECVKCHVPHTAEHGGLLSRPVAETCARCHLDPMLLSEKYHGGEVVENCTACHDPHFGDQLRIRPDAPVDDLEEYLAAQTLLSTRQP